MEEDFGPHVLLDSIDHQQQPPSSPDFHGFGPETDIPGRLVVETAGEGEDEHVVRVFRKTRTGRPRGGGERQPSAINISNIIDQPRKPSLNHTLTSPASSAAASSSEISSKTSSKPHTSHLQATGTQTRPKIYLLDNLADSFGFSKLPKTRAVLSVFLSYHQKREDNKASIAAQDTLCQVKQVWKYHFGERVIMGYDTGMKEETPKMISDDKNIQMKILKVWQEWLALEKESRRERASKEGFLKKQAKFVDEVLDMPFSILGRGYQEVLKDSGIKDWKEDLQHLHNQLEKEQIGTCDSQDFKQKKKDNRKIKEKMSEEAKKNPNLDMEAIEPVDDDANDDMEMDEGDRRDKDFDFREKKKPTKKLDVMGPVSATADRLGLSVRARTVMAASVANTLGVDINMTNISKSAAWERTQKERIRISGFIKDNFKKPVRLVVQWDGKIVKEKANRLSNRVCVYITGVENEDVRKLLGVPETVDGTGMAESEVVKNLLMEWDIKEEVCGMVFDTTSSNTGADIGACRCLEVWLDKPVLWLACRHHVHELHLKRFVQAITGQTKDPGVALFRRLKSEWYTIEIDYTNLNKFDYSSVPVWMQEEAKLVLAWAKKELDKKTWPRADYQELLKLTIICLGGEIADFQFMLPGPDHHARFMSKNLYFLKIKLLLRMFRLSEEEQVQVEEISTFILIFYVKNWFESPLPTAAARNDLSFMVNIMKYRLVAKPSAVMAVEQSCCRHLWYLVPQTVVFALADPGLPDSQKEAMARKLHSLERHKIEGGKPVFPFVDLSGGDVPCMSSFVDSDSWLVFDILGLAGTQDWLTIPASLWENFLEFRKIKEFALNISVCNDIAERGVALITSYMNKVESEEQRQALLQVVEYHRELVKNTNKSSLKLC